MSAKPTPSSTPNSTPDSTEHSTERRQADQLVAASLGPEVRVTDSTDVGQGRGVFSTVLRLELDTMAPNAAAGTIPASCVAKLPVDGPNGHAAIASGAVERELLAYRTLLPIDGLRTPTLLGTLEFDDGSAALLLEDLTEARRVDQLDGLDAHDTLAVVDGLAALHRHFEHEQPPSVRSNTPTTFAVDTLETGIDALRDRWAMSPAQVDVFGVLLDHRTELLDRFVSLTPTLCHGDPRADNLVFEDAGVGAGAGAGAVVLFDWQQIAVQAGEADLAWLLSTSLEPTVRRDVTPAAIRRYAEGRGQSESETADALTTALVLPGLAVLFLAQRASDSPRTDAFIRTSIERIADAAATLASTIG